MGETLTREDFFSTERLKKVEIEQMGGVVYAQPLPFALGKEIVREATSEDEGAGDVYDRADDIICYGIVDEEGERVFLEEDREKIDNLPNPVALTMANAVLDVSDIGTAEPADDEEEGEGGDSGN